MKCTTFQGLTHELIDGALGAADAEAAREHVAGCSECAERLDAAERFHRLLAGEGDAAIVSWAAHMASLQAASESPPAQAPADLPVQWRRRPRRILPFAAVAAASIVVTAFALSVANAPEVLAEGESTVLARGARVLAGEGREIEAEDRAELVAERGSAGAVVRLDAGTVLFRVEPGRAFSVQTPQGTASVLGTSFHVAVTRERHVSVTVHSGRVRFAAGAETETLAPGDRLEVDSRGARRLVSRRTIEKLETDVSSVRDSAARAAQLRAPPPAGDVPARSAPSVAPGADAVRAFFETPGGRDLLTAAIRKAEDESKAQAAARMFDGLVVRFAKSAELTDDQAGRLREIFRRTGAEYREAWAPLNDVPADAPSAERDRVRKEAFAKSEEIERRKHDAVKLLLSQTQWEEFLRQFAPKPGFGGAPEDRGN